MSFWLQKVIVLSLTELGQSLPSDFLMWRPSFGPKPPPANPIDRWCFPCKAPFLPKVRSLLQLLCVFSLPPPPLFSNLICSSPSMSTEAKRHHGALVTSMTCTFLWLSIPHLHLSCRADLTPVQLQGRQSCLWAWRRITDLPEKCRETLHPLIFLGNYSDGRWE